MQLFEPICYLKARIVVVKSDPCSAVGLPDILAVNWQTNGCVPLRIDCSVLFWWYDCDKSSFREKIRRSFAWNCFVLEKLLLDLTHLETPIQSIYVYFRAHTRKSTIHHMSRYH